MTDNTQNSNTGATAAESGGHHHHHRHHGSSHHHSNGYHHSSSHHHHSNHHSSRKNRFSVVSLIKKSSKAESHMSEYTKISRRVIFVTIISMITAGIIYSLTRDDSDVSLTAAGYTPSETSQLRRQITQLTQQVESLQSELDRYIAKYGKLEEDSTVQ